ncbi:MAG: hypothetical protein K8S55_04570 [Phycisphaerae bacterium]|nr:hypothetical protein [Phycisphaerae bacterium]
MKSQGLNILEFWLCYQAICLGCCQQMQGRICATFPHQYFFFIVCGEQQGGWRIPPGWSSGDGFRYFSYLDVRPFGTIETVNSKIIREKQYFSDLAVCALTKRSAVIWRNTLEAPSLPYLSLNPFAPIVSEKSFPVVCNHPNPAVGFEQCRMGTDKLRHLLLEFPFENRFDGIEIALSPSVAPLQPNPFIRACKHRPDLLRQGLPSNVPDCYV